MPASLVAQRARPLRWLRQLGGLRPSGAAVTHTVIHSLRVSVSAARYAPPSALAVGRPPADSGRCGLFPAVAFSPCGGKHPGDSYKLTIGQQFPTRDAYLDIFDVHPTDTPWHQPIPNYEGLYLWGPQYHNSHWHNDGDPALLMPTISEYYDPDESKDDPDVQKYVRMICHNNYIIAGRLREVRLTFMRDLPGHDSAYVFLGVYRMSQVLSDSTRVIWERVATECDLGHLTNLQQLKN